MFKNKILFISEGTGSFGNAVLYHLLEANIKEKNIFKKVEEH